MKLPRHDSEEWQKMSMPSKIDLINQFVQEQKASEIVKEVEEFVKKKKKK